MTVRRLSLGFIGLIAVIGCDRPDPTKFQAVREAATALNRDVVTADARRGADLLDTFRAEVSKVRERVGGDRELAAVRSYQAAADAYDQLLVYRVLGGTTGRLELTNDDARRKAATYKLAVQRDSAGEWIDAKDAVRRLHTFAEERLLEADRFLTGK